MQNLNLNLIDISAWQQHINWQAILDAHIDGVIIKLGEYTNLDEMFIRHVNDAVEYNCHMAYIITPMPKPSANP